MGRLRNLSQSFKSAAFPTASSTSVSRYSLDSPDASADRTPEIKEGTVIAREASSNSTPATSTVYTAPTIGLPANEEIEELKPVFRYE